MKFKLFANQIQLLVTTLSLSTYYSLEVIAQTKPIDSKPDIKIETTTSTSPKQETIKYITYSVSVSGNGYGISGQFTIRDSKANKLDKSDVIDFQLTAAYGGDEFLCDLDSLTSFEVANRNLSFKCENKEGLAALDSLSNSGEIRIVYNGPNRFGQNTSSFSGGLINIQKIYENINNPANIQSFEKWCEQKNDLISETKKTVDLLLNVAGTTNCKKAMYKLQRLRSLFLVSEGITDLQPLSNLTNLTELFLSGNQIKDINPLTKLTNLKTLNLSFNQISDVKPLSDLTNLTELVLTANQIKDVQIFCKMPKLVGLYLSQNPTSQLKCQSQG
jgi:hypothetical protein